MAGGGSGHRVHDLVREVRTEQELRELLAEPPKALWDKDIGRIDEHARTIIAHSPLVLLSTSDENGRCDVSPRGDPAGSVLVLDEQTLVLADRPGNRRVDSFRNILANPRAGLLFLVPGMNETLRVNGSAALVSDAPFFDALSVRGKRPKLAIVVTVTELYMHCAKALLRSALWQPDTWPQRSTLPSMGRIAKDQLHLRIPARVLDAGLAFDAKTNQY